jgi:hypothetical protein
MTMNLVGVTFRQPTLKDVFEETRAQPFDALLTHEPDNPHDRNALAVQLDGRLLGYIPKSKQHFFLEIPQHVTCIVEHWKWKNLYLAKISRR